MPKFNTLIIAGLLMAVSGAQSASAQTSAVAQLTVQSGNGRVACLCVGSTQQHFQPISVKATNSSGVPVAGATVTWTVATVLGGGLFVASPSSVTNANGIATVGIDLTVLNNFSTTAVPYLVSTITAASNSKSVVFTETQALVTGQGSPVIVADGPTFGGAPLADAPFTANSGTALATPIRIRVSGVGVASNGVGNVNVRLFSEQASPTITCASAPGLADPGSVLTDVQGYANCYPVLGGSGTGKFKVAIGGTPGDTIATSTAHQTFGSYNFTSIAGAPARFDIVSGNNQQGPVGTNLNPFVAKLVDANGNGVQGQAVRWDVTPPGAIALTATATQTDNSGVVSTNAAIFSSAAAGSQTTVSLISNPAIAVTFFASLPGSQISMTKVDGDSQSAQVNTTFLKQVVVQLNNTGGPIAGQVVQFSSTGPVSLVEGNSIVTNASGRAAVSVRAGANAGNATVTASVGLANQTFNLTVTSTPAPTITGISVVSGDAQSVALNGAFQPLVVQVNSTTGPLAGTQVGFSSTGPVSISSGAATTGSNGQAQITVQAGSTAGSATVTATAGGFSQTFNLTVQPPGPTITASSFLNAGSRQVGSLSPCSLAILSAPGLTPNGIASLAWAPIFGKLPLSASGLSITFNGVAAPILNVAQGATNPEATFQVPCETTPGSVPVVVKVGSSTTNIAVNVQAVSPGILESVQTDGSKRAVAVRDDGSFADIGGTFPNPVRRNERSRIYVTGLGVSIPTVGTNSIQNPNADLVGPAIAAGNVTVALSGIGGVQVVTVRQAPDLIGVYEVQFLVPGNAPTGNDVAISVGVVPAGAANGTPAVNSLASKLAIQ